MENLQHNVQTCCSLAHVLSVATLYVLLGANTVTGLKIFVTDFGEISRGGRNQFLFQLVRPSR